MPTDSRTTTRDLPDGYAITDAVTRGRTRTTVTVTLTRHHGVVAVITNPTDRGAAIAELRAVAHAGATVPAQP